MSANENDELESAKILIQENLLEEAKKLLFRLLTRIHDMKTPGYRRARELLSRIEAMELDELMNRNQKKKNSTKIEDPTGLIEKLERDLQIECLDEESVAPDQEIWNVGQAALSVVGRFDLAVGFYEMGCYADALRELKQAEKKIRIEETFLGDLGISIVALRAQSLIHLGQAFDAKIYLEPILLEPDLQHEKKIILYYTMGLAEEVLGEKNKARAWFVKVVQAEPGFKDAQQRIKVLDLKS